jgi:hypothetical protein
MLEVQLTGQRLESKELTKKNVKRMKGAAYS